MFTRERHNHKQFIPANIALLLLLTAMATVCHAQQYTDTISRRAQYEKRTEILVGGSWQVTNNLPDRLYLEVGFARSSYTIPDRHGPANFGWYLAEEVHVGDHGIFGTKFGVYAHFMFDAGAAIIYYTDFKKGNLKLRPELGFGFGPVRFVGGCNIPTFRNKQFELLRKSLWQVTFQVFINTTREKTKSSSLSL